MICLSNFTQFVAMLCHDMRQPNPLSINMGNFYDGRQSAILEQIPKRIAGGLFLVQMYILTKFGYIPLHGVREMCVGKFTYTTASNKGPHEQAFRSGTEN